MFLVWALAFLSLSTYAEKDVHDNISTITSEPFVELLVSTPPTRPSQKKEKSLAEIHDETLRIHKGKKSCPRFKNVKLDIEMRDEPILWTHEDCANVMSKCFVEIVHGGETFELSSGCANGEYKWGRQFGYAHLSKEPSIEECENFGPNTTMYCVHKQRLNRQLYVGSYCCTRAGSYIYETLPYQLFFRQFQFEYEVGDDQITSFFREVNNIIKALMENKMGTKLEDEDQQFEVSIADYVTAIIVTLICLVAAGFTIHLIRKYRTNQSGYETIMVVEQNNSGPNEQ